MSLHYAQIERVEDKWQARCQCGWRGPLRDARLTALNDGKRHEARARPPGAYA